MPGVNPEKSPNLLEVFYQRESQSPCEKAMVSCRADRDLEYSWAEVANQVRRVAAAIISYNFEPSSNIVIYGANEPSWIVADLAIAMAGHVSVPIYPNITSENLEAILEDCDPKLVFLGRVDCLQAFKKAKITRPVVRFDGLDVATVCNTISWQSLMEAYEPYEESPTRSAEELATIIYTSGTTSRPKGVMHTFGGISFVASKIEKVIQTGSSDRLFSYGTLAHISERLSVEMMSLYCAIPIHFSESKATFFRDLKKVSPSSLFGNPLFWRKVKNLILNVYEAQVELLEQDGNNKKIEIQNLIKGELGLQNLKAAFVGASPIEKETLNWFHEKLGVTIYEGYGMSETLGLVTLNVLGASKFGSVGQAFDFTKVKLSAENEVLVKHEGLTSGYYRNPKKTKELFDDEGFLRTGDEGYFSDNSLYITGRIGDSFKTGQSNWIYPAELEGKLTSHPHVINACVIGEGRMQPCAVVDLSSEVNCDKSFETVKHNIAQHVSTLNGSLEPRERLDRIVVTKFPWNVENRFMTSTMKVSRRYIRDKYEKLPCSKELVVEMRD